ncbi:unnamed protein product, partial [marine sediment metagenome]
MKKVLIIAGAALGLIVIILVIVIVLTRGKKDTEDKTQYPSGDVTLIYWQLFDDEEALEPIIKEYQEKHKNVTIKYVKKDSAEYETELINSLAGGSGPDLFMIKNDWLPKHQDKLEPIPEDYMSVDEYKDIFAPVAAQDLISA